MDTAESEVYEKLMANAIRFVSYRPRSRKELSDFIARKLKSNHTTAPLVASHVMRRLTDLGYADDHAFGVWWVTQRTGRNPKGARAIRMELLRKGIPPEVANEVIARGMREEGKSEQTLARAASEKKLKLWARLPHAEKKRKVADFLLRRGFSSEAVRGVVDDVPENV